MKELEVVVELEDQDLMMFYRWTRRSRISK
jgi:hypothetical protein